MNIDFQKTEELIESGRKKPGKTIIVVVFTLILIAFFAFITGYCSETGKLKASKESVHSEKLTPEGQGGLVNQQTEGDQSPAIVSDDVIINYGSKEKNKP